MNTPQSESRSPIGPTADLQAVVDAYPLPPSMPHPHVLGHHLPTPGETPTWPFQNIGSWQVDVGTNVEAWHRSFREWRHEHLTRMGYDDSEYRRPELAWSQRNFVNTQMMVEDRFFYDPVAREYTVDRYLDDLIARFGGVDSVLIWCIYPNIGVDDRNQFDLALDLPGGLDGLREAISDFHRREVRVFLATMPWDNGTRPVDGPDWNAITELAAAVGADGINGDTYYGVPHAFRRASDTAGHPLVLQPETWPIADDALQWNNQSWGRASTSVVPAVSKRKWLEPRHLENVEHRWARDRTDDFHYLFFNGVGYVAWENVWGIWNQFTERDGETLRRIATIQRRFASLLCSPEWEPYAPTVQHDIYASRFPTDQRTLWTVVNRTEYDSAGDQLSVAHRAGYRYLDLWNGVELSPRVDGQAATIAFDMEKRGFGAVLAVAEEQVNQDLLSFLATMKDLAATPLQSLSDRWRSLPQTMIEPPVVPPPISTPDDMVAIPPGEFDFRVGGVEIEGYTWDGVDVQYPWESSPRRHHYRRIAMRPFWIDRVPVTNQRFQRFLTDSGYWPADDHNFLRAWCDGEPRPGWENKPVTWVALEDARAYARWAGKRLPTEWEWHYAAQGSDGRIYPWGDEWNNRCAPPPNRGRHLLPPADVDAHPEGASPFGVMDLVGNVWQWTSEFVDLHTRSAILRGGSSYHPRTSHWYFPQAHRLDQHGKYLLMAPSKDRSGMVGFRCVADSPATSAG